MLKHTTTQHSATERNTGGHRLKWVSGHHCTSLCCPPGPCEGQTIENCGGESFIAAVIGKNAVVCWERIIPGPKIAPHKTTAQFLFRLWSGRCNTSTTSHRWPECYNFGRLVKKNLCSHESWAAPFKLSMANITYFNNPPLYRHTCTW